SVRSSTVPRGVGRNQHPAPHRRHLPVTSGDLIGPSGARPGTSGGRRGTSGTQFLPRRAHFGGGGPRSGGGGVWATGLRLFRSEPPARPLRLVAYPRRSTSPVVCASGEELGLDA